MITPSNVGTASVGSRRAVIAGGLITVAVLVAGLSWAKWMPYAAKAIRAARTRQWAGSDILNVGGLRAGEAPSWHAATTFFQAYVASIWPALATALVISACAQALVPRAWLSRVLNRRRLVSGALAGGVASMPSMMCTCCSAPVAVTLRRAGVDQAVITAYWLGNPLLNPAVLVFLLFVAPWQWTLTRLLVGAATVVAGSALVTRITRRSEVSQPPGTGTPWTTGTADSVPASTRFLKALLRLCLVLLPEYLLTVLVIGAGRGWLLMLIQPAHRGLLVVLIAAVLGTLMVIPTAGEIAILQGLVLLGVSSGVIGALLITLPAVSLPGAAMVARGLGWKATSATTVVVIVAGLVGAVLLSVFLMP